jgi:type VI secretion system (T6SS) protein DotU
VTPERQQEWELGVWFALRRLDADFNAMLARAPQSSARPELWADYQRARGSLTPRIATLETALALALPDLRARPGESVWERILSAILIHYDERELAVVGQQTSMPRAALLQTEHCGIYDGGERFFDQLEDALRAASTPRLVLQLFLFCMRAGFCGRYADASHPERMACQEELCRRVAKDRGARRQHAPARARRTRIQGVGFPYPVYVVAVACVLGVWFALGALAEAHQAARSGLQCVDH